MPPIALDGTKRATFDLTWVILGDDKGDDGNGDADNRGKILYAIYPRKHTGGVGSLRVPDTTGRVGVF